MTISSDTAIFLLVVTVAISGLVLILIPTRKGEVSE